MQTTALRVSQNPNLTAAKVGMTGSGTSQNCVKAIVPSALIGKILLVVGAILAVICAECSIILEDGALVAVMALCALCAAVPGWIIVANSDKD